MLSAVFLSVCIKSYYFVTKLNLQTTLPENISPLSPIQAQMLQSAETLSPQNDGAYNLSPTMLRISVTSEL